MSCNLYSQLRSCSRIQPLRFGARSYLDEQRRSPEYIDSRSGILICWDPGRAKLTPLLRPAVSLAHPRLEARAHRVLTVARIGDQLVSVHDSNGGVEC